MLVERVDPDRGGPGDANVVDAILAVDTAKYSFKNVYEKALKVRQWGGAASCGMRP